MRKLLALSALSLTLSACGGGAGTDQPALDFGAATSDGSCPLPYYSDLIGVYKGTVTRDECVFDVDFEIVTEASQMALSCDLAFNLTTDTIDSENCSDVGTHGDFVTAVDTLGNEPYWSAPVYPVDSWAMPVYLPEGMSIAGDTPVNIMTMTINGDGTLSVDDAEGVLRKEQ